MPRPLVAILGLDRLQGHRGGALGLPKRVAAAIFPGTGCRLIRGADRPPDAEGRPTHPARHPGGLRRRGGGEPRQPRAILPCIGGLAGVFDLRRVSAADVAVIVALSAAIPPVENLAHALAIHRARRLLPAPGRIGRVNRGAGAALLPAGPAIPFVRARPGAHRRPAPAPNLVSCA